MILGITTQKTRKGKGSLARCAAVRVYFAGGVVFAYSMAKAA